MTERQEGKLNEVIALTDHRQVLLLEKRTLDGEIQALMDKKNVLDTKVSDIDENLLRLFSPAPTAKKKVLANKRTVAPKKKERTTDDAAKALLLSFLKSDPQTRTDLASIGHIKTDRVERLLEELKVAGKVKSSKKPRPDKNGRNKTVLIWELA